MGTTNLQALPSNEMEQIKGGIWVLTKDGWEWVTDAPINEDENIWNP